MTLKNPLVSFCITTYKRSDFLKTTIESILNQKNYSNIEIVINDNDEEWSAKSVIDSINDNRIIYHKTEKNEWMVKGFNKAFSLSKWDFIVFMSDDDPPTEDMLETLIDLYYKHPDCVGYFGNFFSKIWTDRIGDFWGEEKLISRNNIKKPYWNIDIYSPYDFVKWYLEFSIFSYFLWSAWMVKREFVEKVWWMPDYGYAMHTDANYILCVALYWDILVINKELWINTIHGWNFTKNNKESNNLYVESTSAAYNYMIPGITKLWLKDLYNSLLSIWVIAFLLGRYLSIVPHTKEVIREIVTTFNNLVNNFPFLEKNRKSLLFRLYLLYYIDWKILRWIYFKIINILKFFNISVFGLFISWKK